MLAEYEKMNTIRTQLQNSISVAESQVAIMEKIKAEKNGSRPR